jgi:hypothetical protein
MEFVVGKERSATMPTIVSWDGACSDDTPVVLLGDVVVYARYTAPPFSIAYFPGSPDSSSSKPWKSSLMGKDCAYARNSWLTICLSVGKTAGRILTPDVELVDILVAVKMR